MRERIRKRALIRIGRVFLLRLHIFQIFRR